jgi:hypothetical protein
MKLREFLEETGRNSQYTFVIQKTVKDEHSPFYNDEYKTTPIWSTWEWLQGTAIDKYIVIKRDHPPIDVTGGWLNWYYKGHLGCCMVTTEQDLLLRYGEKQGREMIEYYDRKMREQ